MRKLILKILLLFVLLIIPICIVYTLYAKSKDDFVYNYKKKCDLLESVEGPRLIFVSGSNLAFGLDSRRIQDSLHINVINTGLSISIGLKYMIDDISNYVHEGDILVIAPEYSHFYNFYNGDNSGILTRVVELSSWSNLKNLNTQQWTNVLQGFYTIYKSKLSTYYSTSTAQWKPRDSVYNEYGDEISHWDFGTISTNKEAPIDCPMDADFCKYFINALNKLDKKVKVVMIPPFMMENDSNFILKSIPNEVSSCLAKNGHPFIVKPIEHVLPEEYIFNSQYHATKAGVDIFTGKIIEELRPIVMSSKNRFYE